MSNSPTFLISDIKVQSTINDNIKDTITMKSIIESLDKKLTYWKSFLCFWLLKCLIFVEFLMGLVYLMY